MDHVFARLILRVRLPRKDELNRARLFQQPPQPFDIVKHQGPSLIRSRAAGEADGEDIAIESRVGLTVHFVHQGQLGILMGPPDFSAGNTDGVTKR